MAVYVGEFARYEDLPYGVNNPPADAIVYAAYDCRDYDGSALIVFERDGVLWENHDSHCSCNGLDTWSPERALLTAMMGYTGWDRLAETLKAWELNRLDAEVVARIAAKVDASFVEVRSIKVRRAAPSADLPCKQVRVG